MARLLEKLPLINIFDWADGDKYTSGDASTVLTPELAKSDEETDKAYDERFRQQPKKGNGGKGKESSFKEETKVQQDQLNKEQVKSPKKKEKTTTQKEIVDD